MFLQIPAAPASVVTAVANQVASLPPKAAGLFGFTVRSGLQGAGISKQDVADELHRLEAEAGIVALAGLGILVLGGLVWWKVK